MSSELEARIVAIVGRLETAPAQRVARELERRGSWLVRWSAVSACDVLVVGHGAAATLSPAELRRVRRQAARLGAAAMSERAFLRRLGVLPAPAPALRSFTLADVAAHGRLDPEDVRDLVLLDVIEPEADAFAFRDIVTARQARCRLAQGQPLAALVHAATLRRRAARTAAAPDELSPSAAEDMTRAARLRERADEAERVGNLALAERLYRQSLALDRDDAVAWFCVGAAMRRDRRGADAASLFEAALDRDPALADAWYALGCIAEEADEVPRALACFERALDAERNHLDAVFRLGLLHLVTGDTRRAAPLLERYAAADPRSAWGEQAREALRAGAPSFR